MKYFIFDIETTGLPLKKYIDYKHVTNFPHIVQLSWGIYGDKGENLKFCNHIVKPDNYIIPEEAIKIHKITNELANSGKYFKELIPELKEDINSVDTLVCHNTEFDVTVLKSQMYLYNSKINLHNKNIICTMKESKDFCKIGPKMYNSYKYPKLEELYSKLFNTKMENAHDAKYDVMNLAKCFFELQKLNLIDEHIFTFGKYQNEKIINVIEKDKKYINWLFKQKWFKHKYIKEYNYILSDIKNKS